MTKSAGWFNKLNPQIQLKYQLGYFSSLKLLKIMHPKKLLPHLWTTSAALSLERLAGVSPMLK